MDKVYIAIDLKSFYASVECADRKYDPLTTNLVVADLSRTEKTICLAVSPSLKKHGISGRARLFEVIQRVKEVNQERFRRAIKLDVLPKDEKGHYHFTSSSFDAEALENDPALELSYIVAPPRMLLYEKVSTQVFSVYSKYISPEDIHVYSIDEVFIDATPYLATYAVTAHELAMQMIREVLYTTGITATAGIGTNMYLAKVAMDIVAKHVPADEQGVRIAELNERTYRELLWCHTPITDFWRVGGGTARRLAALGCYTMGDVARLSVHNEDALYKAMGINAELLIDHAWGWESTDIATIKSYTPETTSLSSGQVLKEPYTCEKGIRNGKGEVIAMYPLMPNRMSVERDENGRLYYQYFKTSDEAGGRNESVVLRPYDVLHIPGLGFDGLVGYSPIAMAKNAIGLSMATEEFGSKFFANGAAPSGVLEHPSTIKDPQRVREAWQSQFGGSSNSGKIAVLEEGMKYTPISIAPEQAQFLETRKFQINEIARIFRVPPHMLADLEKSSFSNIEQQSLEFVKYTLDPWVVRWEQSIQRTLFTSEEKRLYFVKFNVEGLLRGDYASRMSGYATSRQNGWMSANDIRELENMDRIPPEEGGDLYLINGNMLPMANAGAFARDNTQKEETDEEVLEMEGSDGDGSGGGDPSGGKSPVPERHHSGRKLV